MEESFLGTVVRDGNYLFLGFLRLRLFRIMYGCVLRIMEFNARRH
jgi:hypothetical protein